MNLSFQDYQNKTKETAIYPGQGKTLGLLYVGLGLGEVGEMQNKIKKVLRDSDGKVTEDTRNAIAGEVGDTLWYLSQLCTELGFNLSDLAEANLAKLASRKERGVLKGSGDNR